MSETLPSFRHGAIRCLIDTMRTIVFVGLVALFSSSAFGADNMKAFPAAEEGMTRYVISLPKQADESAFKVELIIGKTVKTDAKNSYFFAGTLETENIPGWGFDRYILRKLGPMAGTLMAVDPNAPQVERFISRRRRCSGSCATTVACRSSSTSPPASKSATACGAPNQKWRKPSKAKLGVQPLSTCRRTHAPLERQQWGGK